MDMKTAISLPDPVFRSADRLAARLGISRSELYCRAVKDLLARHDESNVTDQLDAIYGAADAERGLDPVVAAMQSTTLARHSDQ
jgi:metal-responsive CopG/Arc/MetJ family transcriptional regulator